MPRRHLFIRNEKANPNQPEKLPDIQRFFAKDHSATLQLISLGCYIGIEPALPYYQELGVGDQLRQDLMVDSDYPSIVVTSSRTAYITAFGFSRFVGEHLIINDDQAVKAAMFVLNLAEL